jgi:hypothetical protein
LKRKANELNIAASGAAAMAPARRIQPTAKRAKKETKTEDSASALQMPPTPPATSGSDDQGCGADDGLADTPSKSAKKKTAANRAMVIKKERSPEEVPALRSTTRTPDRKMIKRKRNLEDYDSDSEEEAVFTDAGSDEEASTIYGIRHVPARTAKPSASTTGIYASMDGGSDAVATDSSSEQRATKTGRSRKVVDSDDSDGEWTKSSDEGSTRTRLSWRDRARRH